LWRVSGTFYRSLERWRRLVSSIKHTAVILRLVHSQKYMYMQDIYNSPTNALVCNKTLIQMSHTKTLKITPTCFDHQMIIIRELFDPG
jgi:hypothetical protein